MAVVIFLVGPTAVGKTAVALEIAKNLAVEIVSADSRQIYKYLDIGTAKPSEQVLSSVPHHFINRINPESTYSAGKFGREARIIIDQIVKRKKVPLVVGGAGFYIQALTDGLDDIDIDTSAVSASLRKRWEQGEAANLYAELEAADPLTAANLQKNDKQRVLRALEVFKTSRKRLSDLQKNNPQPAAFRPMIFGLTAERPLLYKKINARVEQMLEQGLVDEVKALEKRGYTREINALNTVGYKEVFDYLEQKISYQQMVEEIKKNSRRYAKRQLTWFRRYEQIRWFDIEKTGSVVWVAAQIIDQFQQTQ